MQFHNAFGPDTWRGDPDDPTTAFIGDDILLGSASLPPTFFGESPSMEARASNHFQYLGMDFSFSSQGLR